MQKRYYNTLDINTALNVIVGLLYFYSIALNNSSSDGLAVWLSSHHWVRYLLQVLILWLIINRFGGQYWQLTDNSLDYYSNFIRTKHLALADIHHAILSEPQDSKQQLMIYDGSSLSPLNKPNIVIYSQQCDDFTILVSNLQKKLSHKMQGSVDTEVSLIEYYYKKNKPIMRLIWLLFWAIIGLQWFGPQSLVRSVSHVPSATETKILANLIFTLVIITLVIIVIKMSYAKTHNGKQVVNSKSALLINKYIVLPLLVLYFLFNIYLLI